MGGRVIPPRGGKTFEALQLEGAGGAFESFVASLERRRRGLAPLLAVTAVAVLVMVVAVSWVPRARVVSGGCRGKGGGRVGGMRGCWLGWFSCKGRGNAKQRAVERQQCVESGITWLSKRPAPALRSRPPIPSNDLWSLPVLYEVWIPKEAAASWTALQ